VSRHVVGAQLRTAIASGLDQRSEDRVQSCAHDIVAELAPIDGEVVTQTPVRVSVARQALLLMVPKGHEGVS